MSRLERKSRKHIKKEILHGNRRSDAEWERMNASLAKYGRPDVILRLHCQSPDGCRERLAYLEFTAEPAPYATLMIRALHKYEPTDDPRILQRIRLLGATDPKVEDELIRVDHHWPRGTVLQIGCRLGHEWSEFTKTDLARHAAAVLRSSQAVKLPPNDAERAHARGRPVSRRRGVAAPDET